MLPRIRSTRRLCFPFGHAVTATLPAVSSQAAGSGSARAATDPKPAGEADGTDRGVRWFTGPRVQGSAEEMAAIEAELDSLA